MSLYVRLAVLAAAVLLVLGIGWKIRHWDNQRIDAAREAGRQEVRSAMQTKALEESQANARETLRRMERQQENQHALNQALAAARRDAARADAVAERLREQAASAARQWRDALRDSPAGGVCQAAGAAITVQADVQRRLDQAAGELASYATAARIAGLKCERDYDALTVNPIGSSFSGP
jgi:chromosome segregation ATPase